MALPKLQILLLVVLRILAWPLLLAYELGRLPQKLVYDEPPATSETAAALHWSLAADHPCLDPHQPAGEAMDTLDAGMPPFMKIVARRFLECAKVSWMLTYQSALYVLSVELCSMLGLDLFFQAFKPDIEWLCSKLTGVHYTTTKGESIPLSLLNIVDPTFDAPYPAHQGFPFAKRHPELAPDNPRDAHFMCLASKLAYEDMRVITDVVQNRWRMQLHQYAHVPAHLNKAGYVPDLVWFACSNESALVLAFRGADPFNQFSRNSEIPIAMSEVSGMGGVHDGFLRGLFQTAPHHPKQFIYGRLVELLQSQGAGKKLYITGHSLGGALACVFAQTLQARSPETAQRIGGIFTFAAPLIGDAEYCRIYNRAYAGRSFRYVCGADMVAKLPAGFGYVHTDSERLITTFPVASRCSTAAQCRVDSSKASAAKNGSDAVEMSARADSLPGGCGPRVLRQEDGPELLEAMRRREDRLGIVLGMCKLALSPFRQENKLRWLGRLCALPLPGLSDHMPCDYERALREAL
ncbi:hypothetical protein WJX72_005758 [[Myrmecia] bisecta]|uniref:Fungal lipase-type domain-containing protein n=1 Tax=[Myrmecia] bisecta TaxID=41462 RepID=A0AAW1R736_9CHLO